MSKFDLTQLRQFTGTDCYWRISHCVVMTDGTKYVADQARAYWLMNAIASYLPQFTHKEDFIAVKLSVTGSAADLVLDDGNNNVLVQQHIPYTDFPLASLTLYACWAGPHWVIMLPSEY